MTHIEPEPRHLFVYGTLKRGSRNPYAKLLAARARYCGEASAPGRLYRLDGFPGAIFDRSFLSRVHGELFWLGRASLLETLDGYERCRGQDPEPYLFSRAIIEVRLARGGTRAAWAYPLAGEVTGRQLIVSGRF